MRILLVTPEFPPHTAGGILKFYDALVDAWVEAGAEVTVLVSTPFSSFEDHSRHGVRVHFVPLERIAEWSARLPHLAAAPTYRRWIAAGLAAADWVQASGKPFDILESPDFGLLFAPLAGIPDRPPLVVRCHGSIGQMSEHEPTAPGHLLDAALSRLTEEAVMRSVDGLQTYSPANAGEWETRLKRPVAFVPAPLRLPPLPARTSVSGFAGLVAGRIQPWKGPELLCRAFQTADRALPHDVTVAWAGRDTSTGPEGQSAAAWLTSRYPDVWGSRIVPIGQRTAAEIAELQNSVRFAIAPSTWDVFNYTVAEAMALACPVLCSTGAGASYLVNDGGNGFAFAPDDPAALAERLVKLHSMNESRRRQVGEAARSTVASALDPNHAAEASLSAFRSLTPASRPDIPGPWVRGFFEGQPDQPVGSGYLENVSIRELAGHLTGRVARKLRG